MGFVYIATCTVTGGAGMAFKSGIRRLGSVTCSVLSLFPYLCVCLGVGVGGGGYTAIQEDAT